ncbi:hypothetical protein AJ78_07457 [Emergomyces pasteurianus Ep9510]|uniref:Uncharacterized protein n=1 Tax=Emergomyces pasteurianus Ep9510 TaxID=1447872 RepID=A0A1J9P7I4_9EURO|nr:hypothetical protein AJ78_07457 [Emergomyces pasteurianus Ep9510]
MQLLKDTAVKAALKSFKSDLFKNVVKVYAIVWTDKSDILKRPFPDKHLVIMGLEYVDENNSLPRF